MIPDPAFSTSFFLPDVEADLTARHPYIYIGAAKSQEEVDDCCNAVARIMEQFNQQGRVFCKVETVSEISQFESTAFSKRCLWKAICDIRYRGRLIQPWSQFLINGVALGVVLGVLRKGVASTFKNRIQKLFVVLVTLDFCAKLATTCQLVAMTAHAIKKIDPNSTFLFFSIAYSPSFTALSDLSQLKNQKNEGALPTWLDPISGLMMPEKEVRSYRTLIIGSYAIHHTHLEKAFKVAEGDTRIFFPLENRDLSELEMRILKRYLTTFWDRDLEEFSTHLEGVS